jgi:hypothetical protein
MWVIVVAPTEDECKQLRRAVGLEAQVVGMALSGNEARALMDVTPADVLIVDGATPDVEDLDPGERALVWVGEGAPHHVDAHVERGDLMSLESAVTRALIARRSNS